jgi:hypothetical protein
MARYRDSFTLLYGDTVTGAANSKKWKYYEAYLAVTAPDAQCAVYKEFHVSCYSPGMYSQTAKDFFSRGSSRH